ncbi:hypothetical protein M569_06127, partial [Genlisea aurea]
KLFHQKVISFGLKSNTVLCKNLIDLYVSVGEYQSAESVFKARENRSDITLWNGFMAACSRNFMFVEVISCFEGLLLQFPFLKPDDYTYPSLLKACGGLRNVGYGEKIHGRLVKTGFLFDVVVASALVGFYGKCDDVLLLSAVKVFDEIPERDLPCWNNVISCYYQSGQYEKALEYFEKMKTAGLRSNSISFTIAISSCSKLGDYETGKKIHEEVLRGGGLEMDSFVCATLIDMYGRSGSLGKAKELFDGIKNKSLAAWNAMIGAYCHLGDAISCLRFISMMLRDGKKPSPTTISSLLSACSKSAQLKHGRFAHGFIVRNDLFHDAFIYTSLLDFYFKCGCVEPAEKLFRMMPKSTSPVSWNVMISGYVSAGRHFKALDTFDEMRETGTRPDAFSVTGALTACSQLAALEMGRKLHEFVNTSGLNSNEVVMGALLDMYAKCGAVTEAECIFNRLPTKDLVSWTAMIVAYGCNGRASQALNLFEKMVQSSVRPDRITFLAVISACSHGGLVEKGEHYFRAMVDDYKIDPTTAEYSCMIDLLARSGRLRNAYELLQSNGTVLSQDHPDLLSTLLASCCVHGEVELGERIGNLLIETDPDDQSAYILLEKMYARDKRWDEARNIRLRMKEVGLRKKNHPGCSWIEVDAKIESFRAEDKMFPEAEAVYGCLSSLYSQM